MIVEIEEEILPATKRLLDAFDRSCFGSCHDKTILIIEDSEEDILMLEMEINPLGCKIDIAKTGERGLEMIREKDYSIIFLDLNLTGMDGMDVLRAINRMEDHPPVIIVTGSGRLMELPPGSYFGVAIKPVTKRTMVRISENYLK